MKDLQEAIHKYSNVKFLEMLLHGRPGMIYFADKGTMVGSYLGTMMQGTLFLAKNARVLFDSCNIVEGDYGDKFMADLAKKMLIGRGGRPSTLKPRLLRYFRRKWTRFSNGLRVRKVSTRCFLRA
ncbi:MAG: hypothetical protein JSS06_06235 [Proteobacteria bacterium]|nr:hypothetical protein [Pseudomonadota bacterium]